MALRHRHRDFEVASSRETKSWRNFLRRREEEDVLMKDKLALVREYVQQFEQLERKSGDVVQYIQLKLSCKRSQAVKLYDAAMRETT